MQTLSLRCGARKVANSARHAGGVGNLTASHRSPLGTQANRAALRQWGYSSESEGGSDSNVAVR